MTPSLKELALAASSARKALDAGAYSSSGRELAQAEIRAFDSAATPERILELEARAEKAEKEAAMWKELHDAVALGAAVLTSLKSKEPT